MKYIANAHNDNFPFILNKNEFIAVNGIRYNINPPIYPIRNSFYYGGIGYRRLKQLSQDEIFVIEYQTIKSSKMGNVYISIKAIESKYPKETMVFDYPAVFKDKSSNVASLPRPSSSSNLNINKKEFSLQIMALGTKYERAGGMSTFVHDLSEKPPLERSQSEENVNQEPLESIPTQEENEESSTTCLQAEIALSESTTRTNHLDELLQASNDKIDGPYDSGLKIVDEFGRYL